MSICPGTISCYLTSRTTTLAIQDHQHLIINSFACLYIPWSISQVIVVLLHINLLQHIATYSGIMCIADHWSSKQIPYQWISKSNTHCIDKKVTWPFSHCFKAYFLVSYYLPKKSKPWIEGTIHFPVLLDLDEFQLVLCEMDPDPKSVFNFRQYILLCHLRP